MNNPLGVSPSKGKQGTTRGKDKSFDLGGNRTYDFRIRSTVNNNNNNNNFIYPINLLTYR